MKGNKTDGNDAEAICEVLQRPSMRFVPIQSVEQQDVQSLHRARSRRISRSLFHYESRRRVDDEALTGRMMAIAAQKRRYGYRRIHVRRRRNQALVDRPQT